jgi:glutamine phosphoribosylpyrophosphate amidotransferase
MSMAAEIFQACWDELEDARAQVRVDRRDVIALALCTGLDELAAASDEGIVYGATGVLRYLSSDEPREVRPGETVEVQREQDGEKWIKARIDQRKENGGAVRLTLVPEYQ